jgi:nucleotide-binding universal stress UspA family protein
VSRVATISELGQPAVTISEVACRESADLIAMATHGRSGVARLVLGSVATGTLQRASMPVMLVRPAALEGETRHTEPEAAAAP